MYLRRHLQSLALIDRIPALRYRVQRYFKLAPGPFLPALCRSNLMQADIVLCLIRIGTASARMVIEALIKRKITVAPACLFQYKINGKPPTAARQPVITWVTTINPCRNSTRIGAAFMEFKVGRTLQQLIMRGVSKGDIKRAVRRKWIQVAQ